MTRRSSAQRATQAPQLWDRPELRPVPDREPEAVVAEPAQPPAEGPSAMIIAPGSPLLLSIPQAARALGIGRSKTYELITAGELETVHIGRAVRVPADAVEAFVQRLRDTSTHPSRRPTGLRS